MGSWRDKTNKVAGYLGHTSTHSPPALDPTRMGSTWAQSLLLWGRGQTHQFDSYVFICIEILSCGGEGSQDSRATWPPTLPTSAGRTLSDPPPPRDTCCSPAAPLELGLSSQVLGVKTMPAKAHAPSCRCPHLPQTLTS